VSEAENILAAPLQHPRRRWAWIAPLVMLLAVLGLLALQQNLILARSIKPLGPWPVPPPHSATVDLGVTTLPLARNPWRLWQPSDLVSVNRFEHAVHLHASVVMWYADWRAAPPALAQLNAVALRGSVPEITWEPWDATGKLFEAQPRYALRNLVAGRFDAYVRMWARRLAAWGKPVRLRFAQEMNGNWYPWGRSINGNRPGQFVAAWRRVHRIFNQAGARNVSWVWSPVTGAPKAFFPGRREVDMLGVTCLNGGTKLFQMRWRSFSLICGRSIHALHRLAPGLPIELSEVASASVGGSKSAWIRAMFAYLARHHEVKSVIWFELRKEADWSVEDSPSATLALRAGVGSGRFR
jgi:hypothetical protein